MNTLLGLVIPIVVVGLIVWLILFAIDYVGLPEPFSKIAKVIVMVFGIIYLINLLLPLIK